MRTDGERVTVVSTNSITVWENHLNDLNCPPHRHLPPPDILHNVPHGEGIRKRIPDGSESPLDNRAALRKVFYDDCGCNRCRKPKKPLSKYQRKITRGLCWVGWIFCCPVFTLGWALRTAPVDKQDLQEDDCYPCFTSPK